MSADDATVSGRVSAVQIPVRVLPPKLGLLPLIGLMFFTVAGGPYLMGSTAERVVRHANVPVYVFR